MEFYFNKSFMKVLFYLYSIPPNYGGGFLRVFRMAARFKSYGCLYKIATNSDENTYANDLDGIQKSDIIFLRNKFFYSFLLFPLFLIHNRKDFSVFYVASTHWYTVFPIIVCKLLRKRVVIGVTLSMVDSPAVQPQGIIKGLYYKYKNCQFNYADYIFVNSQQVANECKSCGYDDNVVKLINNPVDISIFHPIHKEEKKRLRAAKNFPENLFTILFVGSINKRKGCDILPSIFKEYFRQRQQPVSFVMCGQKGYPESQLIIDELTTIFDDNNCYFRIIEEEPFVAPYYQMADLFIFPTTNEGMPNVILEAMASGCMILCNCLMGITDYLLDNRCLVSDNNISQYVEGIIDFSLDPQKYENLLIENRKKIEREFSVDAVDSIVKYYFEL